MGAKENLLRRHSRTETQAVIEIIWKDHFGNDKFTKARTLDVSETGIRVQVPERIPERSYVTFRVDDLALHGTASVRSCNGKGLNYIVGLEFSAGMKWKPKPAVSEPTKSIAELNNVLSPAVGPAVTVPEASPSKEVETHPVSR
jgi:PilZ domain